MKSLRLLPLLAALVLLTGEAFAQTSTPTETPTATATATLTPTAPPTPTPPRGVQQLGFGPGLIQGDLYVIGKLIFGAGSSGISKSPRAVVTLDIASVTNATCLDTVLAVIGVATGSECVVGLPAAPTANLSFSCFVSAANRVSLRACNPSGSPINPASASYSVRTFAP